MDKMVIIKALEAVIMQIQNSEDLTESEKFSTICDITFAIDTIKYGE